jgi:biopolymer transport protein ExbB/TolQ
MSPIGQSRKGKTGVPDNLYTAILAVAFGIVLASAGFVAYQCYTQYGTLFSIPS